LLLRDSGVSSRVLGILVFIAIMVIPAGAQIDVLVEPSPLTIATVQPYPVVLGFPLAGNRTALSGTGVAGDEQPTVRTLILSVAENVTALSIRSSDLTREDASFIIPASGIEATIPVQDLQTEGVGQVPLTLHLGGVHSGKFTGNLILTYRSEDGKRETLKVPLTVTIKDSIWGPLLVIVFGVLLGLGYFSYRGRGQVRDEILRRRDHLEEMRFGDTKYRHLDPTIIFRAEIDRQIARVKNSLALSDMEGAGKAIGSAWEVWNSWCDQRRQVLLVMNTYNEVKGELVALAEQLKTLESRLGRFRYVPKSDEELKASFYRLLAPRTPEDFTKESEKFAGVLKTQQESLIMFRDLVNQMEEWEKKEPDTQRTDDTRTAIAGLWTEIQAITPDSPELSGFMDKIDNARKIRRAKPYEPEKPKPPSLPPSREENFWDRIESRLKWTVSWAEIRLAIFGFASFFILLAVLVITGFQQLYLANATFGAGAADYFTLFLWGLGVGPGSDAAIKAVREQFSV
jgi:hypothetical protein